MAQSKMGGNPAQNLKVLGDYMQSLESDTAFVGSVGELLSSRIDRVRLFRGDRTKKEMVKEVSLRKRGVARDDRSGKLLDRDIQSVLDQIEDPDIAVDLTLDMDSGVVSLAVEMEPALVGQDLSSLMKDKDTGQFPTFVDEPFDDEFWSSEDAASHLGVAKSTITRRIKANELIGFKLFKNALYVPREQIDGQSTIKGISDVLAMFDNDHHEAWNFLSARLFYGDPRERPIDKLKAVKSSAELKDCLEEFEAAKQGFECGDHM